eukprot:scaffold20980_cov55-Phaeocystis_antarctica.AAC.2
MSALSSSTTTTRRGTSSGPGATAPSRSPVASASPSRCAVRWHPASSASWSSTSRLPRGGGAPTGPTSCRTPGASHPERGVDRATACVMTAPLRADESRAKGAVGVTRDIVTCIVLKAAPASL